MTDLLCVSSAKHHATLGHHALVLNVDIYTERPHSTPAHTHTPTLFVITFRRASPIAVGWSSVASVTVCVFACLFECPHSKGKTARTIKQQSLYRYNVHGRANTMRPDFHRTKSQSYHLDVSTGLQVDTTALVC